MQRATHGMRVPPTSSPPFTFHFSCLAEGNGLEHLKKKSNIAKTFHLSKAPAGRHETANLLDKNAEFGFLFLFFLVVEPLIISAIIILFTIFYILLE